MCIRDRDEELLVPVVMAYQAFQSGEQMDVDASAIPQGVALDDNMICLLYTSRCV